MATKAERNAAALKAAETRRINQAKLGDLQSKNDEVHLVDNSHGGFEEHEVHTTPREEPESWQRPSDLEAPPARPGYVQRWIRTSLGAGPDPRNAQKKFREGWKPREAHTAPRGFSPPTISHGQFGEVIGVEGLVLCEMPERIHKQRQRHYADKTQRQTDAIEQDLHSVERPGNPIEQRRRSRTERGRPRVPPTADDMD